MNKAIARIRDLRCEEELVLLLVRLQRRTLVIAIRNRVSRAEYDPGRHSYERRHATSGREAMVMAKEQMLPTSSVRMSESEPQSRSDNGRD
jgi:hypothetical protein